MATKIFNSKGDEVDFTGATPEKALAFLKSGNAYLESGDKVAPDSDPNRFLQAVGIPVTTPVAKPAIDERAGVLNGIKAGAKGFLQGATNTVNGAINLANTVIGPENKPNGIPPKGKVLTPEMGGSPYNVTEDNYVPPPTSTQSNIPNVPSQQLTDEQQTSGMAPVGQAAYDVGSTLAAAGIASKAPKIARASDAITKNLSSYLANAPYLNKAGQTVPEALGKASNSVIKGAELGAKIAVPTSLEQPTNEDVLKNEIQGAVIGAGAGLLSNIISQPSKWSKLEVKNAKILEQRYGANTAVRDLSRATGGVPAKPIKSLVDYQQHLDNVWNETEGTVGGRLEFERDFPAGKALDDALKPVLNDRFSKSSSIPAAEKFAGQYRDAITLSSAGPKQPGMISTKKATDLYRDLWQRAAPIENIPAVQRTRDQQFLLDFKDKMDKQMGLYFSQHPDEAYIYEGRILPFRDAETFAYSATEKPSKLYSFVKKVAPYAGIAGGAGGGSYLANKLFRVGAKAAVDATRTQP